MIFRVVFLCSILLIIELYTFQILKTLIKSKLILFSIQGISLLVLIYIVYSLMQFDRSVGQTQQFMFSMGLLLIVYVPKLILALILIGEDIFRVGAGALNFFVDYDKSTDFLNSRRKFISQIGLGLAAVPFLSLIYGVTIGKYNYKVIRQRIFFPDLPDAFDGFKITQISDVHSGSFDDPEKINYAIDLVNEQNSDMILFTGDIVNTHAKEMHPWIETFNRIKKHEYGKYSVLG
ncbi:metallophosphoesterase, partial [Flavobacterium franklandianum]